MPPLHYAPPPPRTLVLLLFGAALLSGCGALNPLQGVEPGPDTAWSPAARPSHATPTDARPAPATSPVARSARRSGEAAAAEPRAASGGVVSVAAPVLAGPAALARHLRTEGADWLGTPYRFGGEGRSGIDCSAFTRSLIEETLGITLSRSTSTQVQEGVAVEKDALLPGDLVFFRRRSTRHVGVYLGNGEFIHASSSDGVIVSRLDEGYYERHYWTARRVVDDARRFVLPSDLAGLSASVRQAPRRSDGAAPDGAAW